MASSLVVRGRAWRGLVRVTMRLDRGEVQERVVTGPITRPYRAPPQLAAACTAAVAFTTARRRENVPGSYAVVAHPAPGPAPGAPRALADRRAAALAVAGPPLDLARDHPGQPAALAAAPRRARRPRPGRRPLPDPQQRPAHPRLRAHPAVPPH